MADDDAWTVGSAMSSLNASSIVVPFVLGVSAGLCLADNPHYITVL